MFKQPAMLQYGAVTPPRTASVTGQSYPFIAGVVVSLAWVLSAVCHAGKARMP